MLATSIPEQERPKGLRYYNVVYGGGIGSHSKKKNRSG
jgi:hypothetical protein